MIRTSAIALAAALALGQPAVAQDSASAGGFGMFTDFAHSFMVVQEQYGANIIANTLQSALQRSRDAVRPESKPIPEEVVKALEPFYPPELLKNIRYTIGDTTPAGVAGFAIRNGNAAAVTLIDTVVFKNEDYIHSLALWAHEIHHVEQYKEWGLAGFAQRYAFGWADVEAEASARADAFLAWYKERMGQN
jgi:Domain of unknown function (DUF4157)